MRRQLGWWTVAAAGLWLGACATTEPTGIAGPMVSSADMGRLSPQQLHPVDEAQAQFFRAQQARNRAALQLQDAKNQVAVTEPRVQAADADIKAAEAHLDAAKQSGDPRSIGAAQHELDVARLEKQAREANIDYLNHEVSYRDAALTLSSRQVDLADARLQQSKLLALQQAHNPAANKYSSAAFQGLVENRQGAVQDAENGLSQARQAMNQSFDDWQGARRSVAQEQGMLPARGEQAPTEQDAQPQPQGSQQNAQPLPQGSNGW